MAAVTVPETGAKTTSSSGQTPAQTPRAPEANTGSGMSRMATSLPETAESTEPAEAAPSATLAPAGRPCAACGLLLNLSSSPMSRHPSSRSVAMTP
ncbi:MAG: hypothetical protein SOH58_02275 [Olsenella sp.]